MPVYINQPQDGRNNLGLHIMNLPVGITIKSVKKFDERTLQLDLTGSAQDRSEEHTSELQSLMRISYAVFCLKKKKTTIIQNNTLANINLQQTTKNHKDAP